MSGPDFGVEDVRVRPAPGGRPQIADGLVSGLGADRAAAARHALDLPELHGGVHRRSTKANRVAPLRADADFNIARSSDATSGAAF